MPGVLVILPTYNERENISKLIPDVWKCLGSDEHLNHILVVDDNSPDGTVDTAVEISRMIRNLHIMKRPRKMGLGSAYVDGFRWGLSHMEPDVFIHMDADLSHPPYHLAQLVQTIREGFDVAIASRYVKGGGVVNWPWRRRAISRGANTLVRLLLGTKVRDVTSGYRGLSRNAVEHLVKAKVKSEGYAYLLESIHLLSRQGLKIKEIPFTFEDRRLGKTKLSTSDAVKYAFTIARLATSRSSSE